MYSCRTRFSRSRRFVELCFPKQIANDGITVLSGPFCLLGQGFLPEFPRGDMVLFFEFRGKIERVVIADFRGDFLDGKIGLQKQTRCAAHPHLHQHPVRRRLKVNMKKMSQVRNGTPVMFRQLPENERLVQVRFHECGELGKRIGHGLLRQVFQQKNQFIGMLFQFLKDSFPVFLCTRFEQVQQ